MNVLIFEDAGVTTLAPVTTGRAMFSVRCAGYRLLDLVSEISQDISAYVREYLADAVSADFPELTVNSFAAPHYACLNGRLAPTWHNLNTIHTWLEKHKDRPVKAMLVDEQQVLAAIVSGSDVNSLCESGFSVYSLINAGYSAESLSLDVIEELHDLIRFNSESLSGNLQHRLAGGGYQEIAAGVFSAAHESLPPNVVTDTRHGPIVMESGWQIGPFSILEGPIHLGPGCRIAEHSSIKEAVCTGPTCKLGGEIEATIIEGWSNKQHHGFLGHSYLGSWINLGAGTCNSDLKNTYGKVNMRRGGKKIETGMQFVGCFIGDYAKTAINTSIFTGKTIGVCSMVYGFATNDVAPFVNDAQIWDKATAVDPQVMIQSQGRMFARRNVVQRDCDRRLIQDMFELTKDERTGLKCEPLVF